MRSTHLSTALALSAAVALAACLGTGEDRVTSVDATGVVAGLVYFDANGSRQPEADDPPVASVGIGLLVRGTSDTLVRAVSDADGLFRMPAVPVGVYRVAVDAATVPDSFPVVEIDPDEVIASREDTTTTFIALSFPIASVEEARQLPTGERVFVDGVALNARETFGDQTVHLAGAAAAIRVTQVGAAVIFAGDSVRFLGTASSLDGQPTINRATPFLLGVAEVPTAERATTAAAATADSARLDAALVRIADATVTDTLTAADGLALSVDDGSGPLRILLDADVPFTSDTLFLPGAVMDATGLLVPIAGTPGSWELKPRSDADLLLVAPAPASP